MAIVVEHDKRKAEILKKARSVFELEGYDDATYQKIADRCGIQRTTLYLYFKNKQEIFRAAVKELTVEIETEFMPRMEDSTLSCTEKLKAGVSSILDSLSQNRGLLVVILEYLLKLGRSGGNPDERMRRRTIKLKRYVLKVVRDGIRKKEIQNIDAPSVSDFLYAMFEACIFRLTILNEADLQTERNTVFTFIDSLKVKS